MRRGNQGSGVPRKWGGVQAKVTLLRYCYFYIFQEFRERFSEPRIRSKSGPRTMGQYWLSTRVSTCFSERGRINADEPH